MRERIQSVLLAAVLVMAGAALAAAQVPAGGEFQVNSYTTGTQVGPAVAADAGGNFVVVWQEERATGNGIFGRRFDAAGLPRGAEFQVSGGLSPLYFGSHLASTPGGSFIVSWLFDGPTSTDMWRVRRFGPDGAPLGPVLSGTYLRSRSPDVAMDRNGSFVVVWSELGFYYSFRDILVQRFDASGAGLGAAFQANTYTTSDQRISRVAMDAGGNFVVVWQSSSQDGSGYGIFGQRFSAAGVPMGAEFRANTYTTGDQVIPAVSADAAGRFVVTWHGPGVGAGLDVLARRFDAAGVPQGAEFVVNTYTTGDQYTAAVSSDAAGGFVVTWISNGQDGSVDGLFGRRFRASGAAIGAEFRVNTYTTLNQFGNSVAADAAGNFVAAWHSFMQDGSGYGVFAQRFGGLLPAALAVDTTGGNGVFEPGEGVDVVPSWRNVNGAAQTIGGTAVSFTGPLPATYQINTPFANYATIPNGATGACLDCYRVAVPTLTRPVLHWDAVFDERLTPDTQGQEKAWRVHLGASFTDVPVASPFYRFVETLLHHSITGGCGAATYCPGSSATREQMAVFVLVAKEGASYRPPACGTPVFLDVPASSAFCPFIEELARRGVVSGCGGGNYCPGAAVSREQMPVFVLRTLDPSIDPPSCSTPIFADVPASSPFCRWIEELARRGVVGGCGGGNYCPADPVTREQMAVFIAGAFGLTLYGP